MRHAAIALATGMLLGVAAAAAAAVPAGPAVPSGAAPVTLGPTALPQDTAVPPAERALRDSLRAAVQRVARLERGMLRALEAGDSVTLVDADQRRSRLRATLDSLLDRAVLGTAWGAAELARLRDRYPGSRVLDTYAVRLRLQQGDARGALALADRLLGREADDAPLHALRGRALDALDRPEDAWLAYLRAFDLDPAAEAPFRGLLRLARREAVPDAMPRLLEHVRRLRRLLPDQPALLDREVELLQRMGRLEEARAVQDTAGGSL